MSDTRKPWWCRDCLYETLDTQEMRQHVLNVHKRKPLFDNPHRPFIVLLAYVPVVFYSSIATPF